MKTCLNLRPLEFVFCLLPLFNQVAYSWVTKLARAETTASYMNTTVTSVSDTSLCVTCVVDEPLASTFDWPLVAFTGQVIATVVHQVNRTTNSTTIITRYSDPTTSVDSSVDGGTFVTDVTAFWKSTLSLDEVIIENGIPTAVYSAAIPTSASPKRYLTITTSLTSPATYTNAGFVGTATGPLTPVTGDGVVCTQQEFALKVSDYQIPLDMFSFFVLVGQDPTYKDCVQLAGEEYPGDITLTMTSALTATETDYGDFVAVQLSATPAKEQPQALTPSPAQQHTSTPASTPMQAQTPQPVAAASNLPAAASVSVGSLRPNPPNVVSVQPSSSVAAGTQQTSALAQPKYTAEGLVASIQYATSAQQTTDGQTVGVPGESTSAEMQQTISGPFVSPLESASPSITQMPIVVGGVTIKPGAPAVTISGEAVSLDTSELILVVGGSTYKPNSIHGTKQAIVILGHTITPGAAAVTVGGTAYSLDPGGTQLVAGSTTLIQMVVTGSETLTTMINGVVVSISAMKVASGVDDVIWSGLGGTRLPAIATSSPGIGETIWVGLGTASGQVSMTGVAPFVGGGKVNSSGFHVIIATMMMLVVGLAV